MRRRVPTSEPIAIAEDDDEDNAERGPLRRCIVTRERGAPGGMIRFVLSPDRIVTPDLAARLPGRGFWLSARGDVLETARAKGAFARAARGPVTIPADLTMLLQEGLLRRLTELLGFARRAGQAVSGFAKAREWIVAQKAGLVVQASDGSEDERVRLVSGARELPVVSCMTAMKLGTVFGRDHVVHIAVASGALADRIIAEDKRYAGIACLAPAGPVTPALGRRSKGQSADGLGQGRL